MSSPVLAGLLDSGISAAVSEGWERNIVASRGFRADEEGQPLQGEALPDRIGHGSRLAAIIHHHAPGCHLLNAQIFQEDFSTSAAVAAAALDWAVASGARVVNLSFGLRESREVLLRACRAAMDAGAVLLAAAPARGPAVYPAAHSGVWRITGDARCGLAEVSHLDTSQADFGFHPRPLPAPGEPEDPAGGASFAVAHATGLAAAWLAGHPGAGPEDLLAHFRERADYRGPERRG